MTDENDKPKKRKARRSRETEEQRVERLKAMLQEHFDAVPPPVMARALTSWMDDDWDAIAGGVWFDPRKPGVEVAAGRVEYRFGVEEPDDDDDE